MRLRLAILACVLTPVALGACGDTSARPRTAPTGVPMAPARPATAGDPPDGEIPKLRTGTLTPVEVKGALEAKLLLRHTAAGIETLVAELSIADSDAERIGESTVALDGRPGDPLLYSFVDHGFGLPGVPGDGRTPKLWLRRAAAASGSPLEGDIYVAASPRSYAPEPGRHLRFRVHDTTARPEDGKTEALWFRALSLHLFHASQPRGAWQLYATERLRRLADTLAPPSQRAKPVKSKDVPRTGIATAPRPPGDQGELARLMETTTGATAVQEALQEDRTLFLAARQNATIPIGSLKPPPLAAHPWKEMLVALGRRAPAEPLAASAPADFYYLRAKDLPSLFGILDAADDWGTPAASIADGTFEERGISARYEVELGLRRTALARAFGTAAVAEVGIVGSDPYFREGSDVSVLFRVKSRPLLESALASTLAGYETEHGTIRKTSRTHAGTQVEVSQSADGAVARQRVSLGDVEVVSNSAGAVDALIDTALGKHPKLADEPDFQYMLARDAETRADVLAYLGDRFVAEVVGPRQKVQEARRQIALAELCAPGYSALLFGWLYGKSPASLDELTRSGLLGKEDLSHSTGGAITFSPGTPARSSWGTAAALTPLIDLPVPDKVSPAERAGYERFAQSYQYDWSHYVDPVGLRVAVDAGRMVVDLRQLPLIDGTDYRRLDEVVGASRFVAGALPRGMRGIVALGEDFWLRRELSQSLHGLSRHELKVDWIGDWAAIGVADRAELAEAMQKTQGRDLPQLPKVDPSSGPDGADSESEDHDLFAALARLPLYAEIGVRNPVGAALALSAARVIAEDTIPGMYEWGEVGRYRDVPIVRVALKAKTARGLLDVEGDIEIFYAVVNDALIVSLKDWVLRHLIDDRLDGRGPDAARAKDAASTQAVVEIAPEKGRGLFTSLAWAAERELLEGSRGTSLAAAEALLRGAPEVARNPDAARALALAYFGSLPLSPDGGTYALAREGLSEPARGSPYAPAFPAVPVPGSPLAKVLDAVLRVRSEVSFDSEGKAGGKPMRSLHARVSLDLR